MRWEPCGDVYSCCLDLGKTCRYAETLSPCPRPQTSPDQHPPPNLLPHWEGGWALVAKWEGGSGHWALQGRIGAGVGVGGKFLLPLLFWRVLPTTPALTSPPQALTSPARTTSTALCLGILVLSKWPLEASISLLCSPTAVASSVLVEGREERREEGGERERGGREGPQYCASGSRLPAQK